jgi:RNA polymerase subunit RPABC4/transcription elongation factor Spt4
VNSISLSSRSTATSFSGRYQESGTVCTITLNGVQVSVDSFASFDQLLKSRQHTASTAKAVDAVATFVDAADSAGYALDDCAIESHRDPLQQALTSIPATCCNSIEALALSAVTVVHVSKAAPPMVPSPKSESFVAFREGEPCVDSVWAPLPLISTAHIQSTSIEPSVHTIPYYSGTLSRCSSATTVNATIPLYDQPPCSEMLCVLSGTKDFHGIRCPSLVMTSTCQPVSCPSQHLEYVSSRVTTDPRLQTVTQPSQHTIPAMQLIVKQSYKKRQSNRICSNCGTSETRQWVKYSILSKPENHEIPLEAEVHTQWLCHRCGQYWRKNGIQRPESLWHRPLVKRCRRESSGYC